MHKGKICLPVVMLLVGIGADAAQDKSLQIQNTLRLGYDDNVYLQSSDETGTGYLSEIINISGKLTFSARTDAQLSWQPEFRYRFDEDPDSVSYQTLYGQLNHAVSERVFLTISDRYGFQNRDGQYGTISGGSKDQTYYNNNLQGALNITVNNLSRVNLGAGYSIQGWSDGSFGAGSLNNDYTAVTASGSYIRELRPYTTHGLVGVNYVTHEYNANRGGYDAISAFGGIDQNFSPNLTGTVRLGFSKANVDGLYSSTESTTPYGQAGLSFNPTARTSFTGTMGFSVDYSENSYWNAQERFNVMLGARHDFTAKTSLASSLSYTRSMYESDFASENPSLFMPGDAEDSFLKWSVRASYQLNRNNFLELGYEYSTRWTDTVVLQEYDRSTYDIGWRLRF